MHASTRLSPTPSSCRPPSASSSSRLLAVATPRYRQQLIRCSVHATTVVSERHAESGSIVQDQYRLVKRLGRGGFAEAWLAEDLRLLGRRVVIKLPNAFSGDDPWPEQKFNDEIKALASLNHPGIVSPLAFGRTSEGMPFLVMEYIEGDTLRDVMRSGSLTLGRVGSILLQLGRALRAIRDANIYHRDLKPENVMVEQLPGGDDHVRLIDFGIASIKSDAQESVIHTRIVGSLRYMAPEQLRGEASSATDVYAFAVIACELIGAALPDPIDVLMLASSLASAPAVVASQLPAGVAPLLAQGLDANPRRRPSDVSQFAGQLVETLSAGHPPGRRPTALQLGAASLMMLAMVIGAAWYWRAQGPTAPAAIADAVNTDPRAGLTRLVVSIENAGTPLSPLAVSPEPHLSFSSADRFRLRVSSSIPGHLYLFAQSSTGLHVLFPSSTTNAGSSALDANEVQQVPEKTWLEFGGAGQDRLWLAWSRERQQELEAAAVWANPTDAGEVKDTNQAARITTLLGHKRQPLSSDPGAGSILLTGADELLVGALDVRH